MADAAQAQTAAIQRQQAPARRPAGRAAAHLRRPRGPAPGRAQGRGRGPRRRGGQGRPASAGQGGGAAGRPPAGSGSASARPPGGGRGRRPPARPPRASSAAAAGRQQATAAPAPPAPVVDARPPRRRSTRRLGAVAGSARCSPSPRPRWASPTCGAPRARASWDCSGLTMKAWQQAGVYLSHYTGFQWARDPAPAHLGAPARGPHLLRRLGRSQPPRRPVRRRGPDDRGTAHRRQRPRTPASGAPDIIMEVGRP